MRDLMAVVGAILLLAFLWLGLITINHGGIERLHRSGNPAEAIVLARSDPAADRGSAVQGGPALAQGPDVAVSTHPTSAERPMVAVEAPTALPPTSVSPWSPVTSLPTPLPMPAVVAQLSPSRGDGDLPTARVYDSSGLSTVPAVRVSPWDVLSWLTVGVVPAAVFFVAGLVAHRHVALTRARAEAIRRAAPAAGAPTGGEHAGQPEETSGQIEGGSRQVDVAAYLAGANGGRNDGPGDTDGGGP